MKKYSRRYRGEFNVESGISRSTTNRVFTLPIIVGGRSRMQISIDSIDGVHHTKSLAARFVTTFK